MIFISNLGLKPLVQKEGKSRAQLFQRVFACNTPSICSPVSVGTTENQCGLRAKLSSLEINENLSWNATTDEVVMSALADRG